MSQFASIDVQAIRRRAHERWLERGCPTGSPERDWLEAERELRAEATPAEAGTVPRGPAPAADLVAAPAAPTAPPVAPTVTRRRAPRTFVTSTASTPAARLFVALVPGAADAPHAAASGQRRR